ncbi:suppressor of cytokine signaling 3 [Protopterus annectens]|uniref:suppressor of cytokine signaling 3 n=1 Tax=Protopterus annectens TaxID=7888 RepID=UPI001CFC2C4B|nr:suppressor of cytokine signaling 3 [Protopterus annectens]
MVTHSKINGMNSPLNATSCFSYHFKAFTSPKEYNLVMNAVRKLQESGFYWSTVTGKEADTLLHSEPAGTFLIRDSSDNKHFFTLSVKTESGTKNLRIECDSCFFSLQTDPKSTQAVPKFDCVLKLVHHYMPSKCSESGDNGGKMYYIYSGREKIPLVLSRPLSCSVSTLQHLCRKTVNGHLEACSKVEQLPSPIKDFLQQYDVPV